MNTMLTFEPFSTETLKRIQPYIVQNTAHNSDLSAGFIYMWHRKDSRFCIYNDTLVIKQRLGDNSLFTYPVGKDVDGMIDELLIYSRENKLPMRFYPVTEEILERIKNDKRLQPVVGTYDRNWSDYIYSFEDMKEFKGRRFSGQRNHINKFKSLFGDPDIRFVKAEDMPEMRTFLEKYANEHSGGGKMEMYELNNTKQLLEVYSDLGLYA
ncbi:MAG: DUF2156 domain-containing protein, partial [Ruminococcaceae bacterium]|nr:DUF2156 domain-containing protein [Oscillospiraceae bacterium]